MKCKEYVFLVSSGRMAEAPWSMRAAGQAHRLTCPYCRAFARNDQALSEILDRRKDLVPAPPAPPHADADE